MKINTLIKKLNLTKFKKNYIITPEINSKITDKQFSIITNYSKKNSIKKLGIDNSISEADQDNLKINTSWKRFVQLNAITIDPSNRFLKKNDKIMTIGSCFANEIRKSFIKSNNFQMLPKVDQSLKESFCEYFKNSYTENGIWDVMPHFQCYNTFSIVQEFEKVFGNFKQSDNDFFKINGYSLEKEIYVDPYRRYIEAKTFEDFVKIKNEMDESFKNGVFESDLIIITLGMTELFKRKDNNLAVCQFEPRLKDFIYFENSTFEQNYNNLNRICKLVFNNFPNKKIIVTVSPIPLLQTFRNCDIFIANTQSKSILRSVIGELESKWTNLHYFPSFEIANLFENGFQDDKRHVNRELIDFILNSFNESFLN